MDYGLLCATAIIPTTVQHHLADMCPRACLCREYLNLVVAEATRDASADMVLAKMGEKVASSVGVTDFYLDENERTVFIAACHLKRGYTCGTLRAAPAFVIIAVNSEET